MKKGFASASILIIGLVVIGIVAVGVYSYKVRDVSGPVAVLSKADDNADNKVITTDDVERGGIVSDNSGSFCKLSVPYEFCYTKYANLKQDGFETNSSQYICYKATATTTYYYEIGGEGEDQVQAWTITKTTPNGNVYTTYNDSIRGCTAHSGTVDGVKDNNIAYSDSQISSTTKNIRGLVGYKLIQSNNNPGGANVSSIDYINKDFCRNLTQDSVIKGGDYSMNYHFEFSGFTNKVDDGVFVPSAGCR